MTATAVNLIRDLEATRDETLSYFSLAENQLSRTYGRGKWSVRFLLHHLADSETVLNERIRRVLSEPTQTLMVFDEQAWARSLEYDRMPLQLSRDVYSSVRNGIIYLAERYYASHGHLTWIHSTMGQRTLAEEFDKVAAHNSKHLEHIRLALGA
jgi:hypothetical protein